MLSRKQMRRIIRATYGTSAQFIKQIKQMYDTANLQVKGEISRFVDTGKSWQGKPSEADLRQIRQELEQYSDDQNIAPLVGVFASAVTLGHPKNSDVETGRLAVPFIRVAQKQHQQLEHQANKVPQTVARLSKEQSVMTPELHRIPFNYGVMMQRQVSNSVTQRIAVGNDINRNIMQTIKRVQAVCQQAAQTSDESFDFAKAVDRIISGRTSGGGATARAQMIMRTETCTMLNNSTIADFKARGVSSYTFMSLEADNTCAECSDLDGNVYDVDDAQEGVNLPPMHPNCQCWIVEHEDDEFI